MAVVLSVLALSACGGSGPAVAKPTPTSTVSERAYLRVVDTDLAQLGDQFGKTVAQRNQQGWTDLRSVIEKVERDLAAVSPPPPRYRQAHDDLLISMHYLRAGTGEIRSGDEPAQAEIDTLFGGAKLGQALAEYQAAGHRVTWSAPALTPPLAQPAG